MDDPQREEAKENQRIRWPGKRPLTERKPPVGTTAPSLGLGAQLTQVTTSVMQLLGESRRTLWRAQSDAQFEAAGVAPVSERDLSRSSGRLVFFLTAVLEAIGRGPGMQSLMAAWQGQDGKALMALVQQVVTSAQNSPFTIQHEVRRGGLMPPAAGASPPGPVASPSPVASSMDHETRADDSVIAPVIKTVAPPVTVPRAPRPRATRSVRREVVHVTAAVDLWAIPASKITVLSASPARVQVVVPEMFMVLLARDSSMLQPSLLNAGS